MKYSRVQIAGFVGAVILVLVAAVLVVDAGVRGVGYAVTAFESIPNRAQPEVITDDEAVARGEALLGLSSNTAEVSSSYAASERMDANETRAVASQPAKAAKKQTVPLPRYANAIMSYHAFGTIWRGSFVSRSTIDRDEIPAIRAMVYNNGSVATNAWTFSCNWEGNVTITHQAPLGAGERAFAVCTTSELSRGTHTVALIYQEAGKATQSQTVSVRVD